LAMWTVLWVCRVSETCNPYCILDRAVLELQPVLMWEGLKYFEY